MRLSMKVRAAFTTLAVVGFLAATATLYYAWHMRRDIETLVASTTAELTAAAELDIALLKQNGQVASFIFDEGNDQWLEELTTEKPDFKAFLGRMDRMVHDEADHAELVRVGRSFDRYNAARNRVVELYRKGDHAAAKQYYVAELNQSYREISALCDKVLADRRRSSENALVRYKKASERLSLFIAASVLLAGLLGGGVAWLLFGRILGPLQRMSDEARVFSAQGEADDGVPPVDDLDGLAYYLRALMTEVSDARQGLERHQVEQERLSKLAAVGKTVAQVAHELRNRLTVLGGFASLIERRPNDASAVREHARVVCEQVKRLEHLLGDIMDFSKPLELETTACSLNAMVEHTVHRLIGHFGAGVRVKMELHPAPLEVVADAARLEQVILNLLRNAAEAAAEVNPCGAVTIRTGRQGESVVLVIEDTGPGITSEIRERIFEPFFTTKRKGTGLGLAICRQIVAKHGGTIRCESTPGNGTAFTVALPAGQRDESPRKNPSEAPSR